MTPERLVTAAERQEAARILRAAAALVDKGWVQYRYAEKANGSPAGIYDGDKFCAHGAILHAGWKLRQNGDLTTSAIAFHALRAFIGGASPDITKWNDGAGRKQSDVSGGMRIAAMHLEH